MELKEIISNENPVYNNLISFNISNQGDLLHKCYLEIEVPILSITDSIITNSDYITFKNLQLESIQNKINDWYTKYLNLENYSSIEFIIYKKLLDILQSENITINKIKSKINALSNSYQINRNKYKLLVDETLFTQIDIVGYITNLDPTMDTSTTDIKSEIDTKYNLIIKYLKYYHSNWIYNKSKYDDLNKGNINYSWSEYLGHNYINNYN